VHRIISIDTIASISPKSNKYFALANNFYDLHTGKSRYFSGFKLCNAKNKLKNSPDWRYNKLNFTGNYFENS
jgi:hypothetical protein